MSRRVLMITPSLYAGGAESQFIELALGLARRGEEVTVAHFWPAGQRVEPLRRALIRVVDLGLARRASRPLAVLKLAWLARDADLVYCGLWDASLWGRLAALLARRPAVVTEHTGNRHWDTSESSGAPRGHWVARGNRLLAPFTAAVVACGRSQLPLLTSEGVPKDKIVYIPNGAPIPEIRAASEEGAGREELEIPTTAKVLVQVGNFYPQKDQRATLEATGRLRESLGDVHAVFAGEGPERPAIERRAAEMGADWAHFIGQRSDVPSILALGDVAVLPSLGEGMPMALVEALAVGIPVVATDVGDVRAVLEETGAGLCVPPGDLDAFTAACNEVLSDHGLHERLAARARASRHFDAGLMTERYAAVFDAVLAGRPPGEGLPSRGDGRRATGPDGERGREL